MNFQRDILVVDLEMSSDNTNTCDPLQIGAVLLDKDTLKEKDSFSMLIKPGCGEWNEESAAIHGLDKEDLLARGIHVNDAFRQFEEKFNLDKVRIACWGVYDIEVIEQYITPGHDTWKIFEIWSYTFPWMIINNIDIDYVHGLNFFIDRFDLQRLEPHDALCDARIAAEVFRHVSRFYEVVALTCEY